jgi:hypothetical protein
MSIYGQFPKGTSRSEMSLSELIDAGVNTEALIKRSRQVNDADLARNMIMAKINEATSFKELRQLCKTCIKASVRLEYFEELQRLEPVAGPLYRPEEFKARLAAWCHAQNQRGAITASIKRAFFGEHGQ